MVSHVGGITGACHHDQLIDLDGVSVTSCLTCPQTTILPISITWVARIPSVSHCIRPLNRFYMLLFWGTQKCICSFNGVQKVLNVLFIVFCLCEVFQKTCLQVGILFFWSSLLEALLYWALFHCQHFCLVLFQDLSLSGFLINIVHCFSNNTIFYQSIHLDLIELLLNYHEFHHYFFTGLCC
jgi:hypothetical protein